MLTKTFLFPSDLAEYVGKNWVREPEILKRLREETASMPEAGYQIGAEQAVFMQMLVRLMGAKKVLELGVFTGYSSLAVALALPDDAEIVACDISDEFTQIARRYWQEAGVADRIMLKLGPALETLDWLIAQGESDTFDFAFVDADKGNYEGYYERALQLVRPGGLIALDNVLQSGRITNEASEDVSVQTIRRLNAFLLTDERIDLCLVPIADGVTLAMKR
jgi:caffeoyl-CoA O-methyltransferase